MSDLPRRLFRGPLVLVEGTTATVLVGFLRRHRREWREHAAVFAAASLEVAETVAALEMAAEAFKQSQVPDAEAKTVPPAEVALASAAMVTTETAAGRRGVSERWIRQLLMDGRLHGKKIGGRWMVDAKSLEK